MKFSVIVPFIPGNAHREVLWEQLLRRYRWLMPDVEVCVGAHDQSRFCKAKAVNEAFQRTHGDILLIVDADVFFAAGLLNKISAQINEHPWIIPFSRGIRLTREATERILTEGLPDTLIINQTDILHELDCPGALMNVMTRACFEAVGGFDERFEDYGGEDEAFAASLDTLCGKHYRLEETIYHLWHEPAELTPDYHRVNYPLYLRYQEANGNIEAMKQLIRERIRQ